MTDDVPVPTNNPAGWSVSPHGDQNYQPLTGSLTRMLPHDWSRRACCGRCVVVPRYWQAEFRWETPTGLVVDPPPPEFTDNIFRLPEDFPYMTPQWNEKYVFDDIHMKRRETFYRLGAGQTTDGQDPLPYPAEMLRCFWRSKLYTNPETLWQMHWYLFYGDSTADSSLGGDVPANVLANPFVDFDSECESAGNEFDQPPTYRGWVVMLIRRQLQLLLPNQPPMDIRPGFPQPTDPSAQIITVWRWYGAWRPIPPEHIDGVDDLDQPKPIFKCNEASLWEIFHNPLAFPQHTLRLSPFYP